MSFTLGCSLVPRRLWKGNVWGAKSNSMREKTTFVLGGILAYIKRNHSHATIPGADGKPIYDAGLAGFNSYVEETLGLKSRSAHYYVQVYEKLSPITTEEKINQIGWSKLIQMVGLDLNPDNVEEWLEKAEGMQVKELKEAVRVSLIETGKKVHGKTDLSKKVHFSFVVFEDQGNVANEALDKAKGVIGEDKSISEAFSYICRTFLELDDKEATAGFPLRGDDRVHSTTEEE